MGFTGGLTPIGKFSLSKAKMRVSDPCYTPAVWCSGTIDAKAGIWEAAVLELSDEQTNGLGRRIAALAVKHKDTKLPFHTDIINKTKGISRPAGWNTALFEVGVDSGQAGFFDDAIFTSHRGGSDEKFYDDVCNITLGRFGAGVMKYGAASSSGYGDGSYVCIYHTDCKNGNLADFAYIIFIDENDENMEAEE